ncbi:MAG TPA: MlaD family protein [Vicinamibacterales bacterium]|jgi:phospholipid/cholesterol/gamma-HCH transport system substrate-binding protein|nr:MlaD family protein [Vicinamibacterales bacterium]
MKQTFSNTCRVALILASSIVLAVLVVGVLTPAVHDTSSVVTADFTDVSGLQNDADVRVRGVAVGKVTDLTLVNDSGRTVSRVQMNLQPNHSLRTTTKLAVRYQNLTGARYIDVTENEGGEPVTHLDTVATTPSFDITSLFNGMAPILREINPADVEKLSNALTSMLIGGEGANPEDVTAALKRVTDQTTQRQTVITTLVNNLAAAADSLGGRSQELIRVIALYEPVLDQTLTALDQFQLAADYGPQFTGQVNRLLRQLGLRPDLDIDKTIDSVFSTPDAVAKVLSLVPQLPATLSRVTQVDTQVLHCSKGAAAAPPLAKVLLGGQEFRLCVK